MSKPRIFVAYTGGTIGMKRTADGYQPVPGYLQKLMAGIPQFRADDVPEVHVEQFDPLLDSSNMTPADWVKIARALVAAHDAHDGFLVIHGTDTMAFTASALSFMLAGFAKPVVVMGSQIPLAETRNDAQENLLTSLILLGKHHARLRDVYLYFDNRLFRGNRTTKVNADGFAAFASPNLPPVGSVGVDIDVDWNLANPRHAEVPGVDETAGPRVVQVGEATVAAFRLFPGIRADYLRNVLAPPVQGLVLECFGSGNAPVANRPFMDTLREATARGVVIVDVPQPLHGSADLSLYATGRALAEAGVVSGYDMTAEAALAKLFFLFELGHPPAVVRELMARDLRGELTPPESAPEALRRSRRRLARST
jgi:L-asparaginase